MTLAEQTGLTRLLTEKIAIGAPRIKSGAPKLATLIAGMCAGADNINDVDLLRSGGCKTLFDGVYAPSTVGALLREFTFGHTKQLDEPAWPWSDTWLMLWHNTIGYTPPQPAAN